MESSGAGISAAARVRYLVKMIRAPKSLSPNRSLVVLFVLVFIAIAGIAAARELSGPALAPVPQIYAPAENPVPLAPAVEASSLPVMTGEAAPAIQTGVSPLPGTHTQAPAAATPYGAAPTAAPHPTVPVGPATTAAPTRDIPVIAPEPGMPTPPPPPGRE